MILKHSVVNPYGNKIEKGEQVYIISSKDNEVYVMPLKRTSSDPIGLWVKKDQVE